MTIVAWEGEEVELESLRPGPGYDNPCAKMAREKNISKLMHVEIEDIIDDPHELERVNREVLHDLVYLELTENLFPRVRVH